ncbi:MAG: orotidine-5'-phosphate decarboxylase [Gemmatimonadota bacterium]|jgi:orotidine-5'-phosphate decarboxylase|nr:orotidine-5'-phosphate decarboxylase [Gemmatimonadota bacterium]
MTRPLNSVAGVPVSTTPVPVVALDFPDPEQALALVDQLPEADFYKVGLELFSVAGPAIVHELRARNLRVFLDLKLHDIPNTVASAVRAAGALGVDLLTVHASGGPRMLAAAVAAAHEVDTPPRVLAVTVLTSLTSQELRASRGTDVDLRAEAIRLAALADEAGVYGVVTSVHEVEAIRTGTRADLPVLTPGIRFTGGEAGDQARVATPAEATLLGVNYMVIGRAVTAAPDPRAAWSRVAREIRTAAGGALP